MTAGLRVSPLAARDLRSIQRYTFQKWGAGQAARYSARLESVMEALRVQSVKGRPANLSRKELRKELCGKHYIFFEYTAERLFVSRVLHTAMDTTTAFFPVSAATQDQ